MSYERLIEATAWGDYIDPYEFLRDDEVHGWRLLGGLGDISTDRVGGQDRPIFQSERELSEIRGWGRHLSTKTPIGVTVMENLVNYTIGKGFSYRVKPADESAKGIAAAAQRVIDAFLDDNDWVGGLERELYSRAVVDGEYFVLLDQQGGSTRATVIEPANVTQPMDARPIEDWLDCAYCPCCWRFGVHTSERDMSRAHGYHVVWDASGNDWDYFAGDKVEHFRRNVPRNVKRGVSDYLPVRIFCLDVEKLLRNTMRGAQVQAAIAYIRKFATGTTQAQVQGLIATKRYDEVKEFTPQGSRMKNVDKMEPGTVLNTGNHDYVPGPSAENAPAFIEVVQAGFRYLGARWCMPEYMISADASNGNYSSTLVAEAPFVKAREHDQSRLVNSFSRVMWKVLKAAHARGLFGPVEWSDVERSIDVMITPPDVASRDRAAMTQSSSLLHQAGILSPRTWAAREGLDYADEKASGASPQAPIAQTPFRESDQTDLISESIRDAANKIAAAALREGYP